MPEIIRCPGCDAETYRGLAACPHCDAAMPPHLSLGATPPADDSEAPARLVPRLMAFLAFVALGVLVKMLFLG